MIEFSRDPTVLQVRAQVEAFGAPIYEVGVIPPRHRQDLKPERTRRFTAAQLSSLRTIGWLKFMNLSDRNIFCRPAPLADGRLLPLIFVDDLSAQQLSQMKRAGLPLAIVIELSSEKFHGWTRVASEPINRAEAQGIARELARRFGGDLAAAAWNQYGRLAGFTNRKRERVTDSGPPFALLRAASQEVAPAGLALLAEVRTGLEKPINHRMKGTSYTSNMATDVASMDSALAIFCAARARVSAYRSDGTNDYSAEDFGAACTLVEQGFLRADIELAVLAGSPRLRERHRDAEDYARRTADAARRRASR